MLWTVKRLYTILIVLVLWEDTNGFGVWNSTSVGYWQAGHPDTIKSSNAQLSTGVEPFKLLARKGANRNVGRGNSSSVLLNSEDQTAQHDSSFAQFSRGVAHDESIQYGRSQASTTIQGQEKLQSQPLSFYRFEFPKPDHYGVLLSQPQSAATTNQAYGSQSQSSYQPSTTTLALAGQSASKSQAKPSSDYIYQAPTSGGPLSSVGPSIPSCFQSEVSTSKLSGIKTQSLYQPTSQAQPSGGYKYPASTFGKPLTSLHPSIPSSSQAVVSKGQLSEIQTQSASTSQAQPSGFYTYASATFGKPLTSLGLSIPASPQSAVSTGQLSGFPASYQHSTTTPGLASLSSTAQAQLSGGYMNQPATSGKPLTSLDLSIPSSSQSADFTGPFSGFQSLYPPTTTTWALAGQSASTSQAQPSGGYTDQAPTSGRPLTNFGARFSSSSHPAVSTGKLSGFPASYQPSTTAQVLAGQSGFTSQTQPSGGCMHQAPTSGRPLAFLGTSIPSFSQSAVSTGQLSGFQASYQPSTTTQGLAGQSAFTSQDQLSDGYTYPAPTSGRHLTSLGQRIPSSSQVAVSTGRLPGIQTQSAYTSLAQPSGFYMYPAATSGKPLTSLGLSIPSSSQSAVFTSQLSGIQASYQPTTTTQGLAGQSAFTSLDQSSGGYTHQAPTSGRPLTTLGTRIPSSSQVAVSTGQFSGFQTQASYQPSTTAQALAGPFASTSHGLPAGGYMPQAPTFGKPLTSLGQRIPASSQSAVFTGQLSGIQASYKPSTTTQDLASLSFTAQPSGGYTYQAATSGKPLTSLGQRIPSLFQFSGFQSLYLPTTTTQALAGHSTSTSQAQSSGGYMYQAPTSGRPLTFLGASTVRS